MTLVSSQPYQKPSFERQLLAGKTGESTIAKVLRFMGYNVLPVYEVEQGQYKGPVLYSGDEKIIAPDLLVFRNTEHGLDVRWVEAKTKNAFTHHRISDTWNTGIDVRMYEHYLRVHALSKIKVVLMFLQTPGEAKDTPPGKTCPTGLYYGDIDYLSKNEHHRHISNGKPMVYWTDTTLRKIYELAQVSTITHAPINRLEGP